MSSSEHCSPEFQDDSLVPLPDPPPPPPPVNPDQFILSLDQQNSANLDHLTIQLNNDQSRKLDDQEALNHIIDDLEQLATDQQPISPALVDEPALFNVENTRYLANPGLENTRYPQDSGFENTRYLSDTTYDLPQQDSLLNNHADEPSRSSFTQTFLRGILSSLESKDPVVANAWLETLLDAIDLLPVEVIRQEIISIAVAKGELSQPVCSRLASCQILGKLATKLDMLTVRQEILPVTLSLSQDIQWEVRKCMCTQLAYVSRGVGLDLTKSAVIPVLVELSNDKSVAVRVSAVETIVQILNLLDDSVCASTIVPLVIKCCENAKSNEDSTLAVIAKQFSALCHGLGKNLSQSQRVWLIQFFQYLATLGATNDADNKESGNPMPDLVPRPNPEPLPSEASAYLYSECRQQCALNIPGVLLFTTTAPNSNSSDSSTASPTPSLDTASDDTCSTTVVSILCKLVRDPDACVRSTLASSLSQLVWILGARLPNLKEEMVLLFNDTEVTVLTCMVNAMVFIIDALARYGVLDYGCTSVYGEELGFAILHLEEVLSKTRDWRLHSDCLEKISCLANCLSKTMIQENFVPMLMIRATKSRPLPTRVAAVRTLLVILRFTIKNEHREKILHRIETDLKLGRSCHTRQLFLKLCEMSLMLFSKAYFKLHFFQHCVSLYKDAVPNVRLRLVTLLPQVRATLQLPEDGHLLTMIESAIKELLLTEADRDVLAALQVSIGTIEEADLSSSSSNLPGLQAKEDQRKEREEQLILNMESEPPETGNNCENSSPPSPISFQPAAPARLRTLVSERKRSESLPPSLKRRPLVERLLSAPPSPSLLAETSDTTKTDDRKPGSPPLWKSESLEDRKVQTNSSFGYIKPAKNTVLHGGASHLENLDQNAHEFLVDTGVILTGNTGFKDLRSSLPNLSMQKGAGARAISSTAKEPIGGLARTLTPPPTLRRGNSDLGISNILISNEEMQEYEKNFERASSLSPRPYSSASEGQENKISTSLHKSSISKMLKPKITNEVNSTKEQSSPLTTPPNSSPRSSPKFSMRSSLIDPSPPRRWNDGTIERMAEKWAAKRDSLRRETGFVPENLQGRKATMEQRLESVKRSIPRGSTSAAQKRLSLNEDSNKLNNSNKISPKRKSLDFESVFSNSNLPSSESKSTDENIMLSPSEISGLNIDKLPSPDFDSSDSDDSLPPYPSSSFQMDRSNDSMDLPDIDDLLPPPPPDIDENLEPLQDLKNLKLIRPLSSGNTFSNINTTSNTNTNSNTKYSTSSKLGKQGIYPGALALPQKSLTSYYKTVPAPHTSVAVSKTLPSPRRSIAGSLKSPADLKINQIKAANEKLIKDKLENEKETKDSSDKDEVDNKINNDSYIEPNNNNINKVPLPEAAKLNKEIKRTSRLSTEQKEDLSIKKHSVLNSFDKVEGPNTTLQIIDCVEGPSQVYIKSPETIKPNQFSRGLKKPATSISLKESEVSPVLLDNVRLLIKEPTVQQNVKTESKDMTAASPVTPRKSTSTLPRSRLSASGGSKLSSHLQRRSYGGVIESKLSTPVSSTTSSGLRFASAPSTPRSSTSDLRSLRSPGRSPIGSTTNLRVGSSQELRKGVSQELRKGAGQDMRKGMSQELRRGSSQELNKPRLKVNSKPTSSSALDQTDKHEITITSFDKQNPSQMIVNPKYSSQSNLETGISVSSSKYHSRLGMNRYSLELGETKQASMKSIGSSLDYTSRHSSLPPSTPVVVSSNVSSTDRGRMVGKPMLSHTTQSTTSYLTSSSKIIPMPETSPKNSLFGKSKQFGKHDINKNNQFVQGNRSMSSNALVHSPRSEPITSPSPRRHAMTVTTTSSKVTQSSQLSSSKLVQANTSSDASKGQSIMPAKASKLKNESSKAPKGGDDGGNHSTQLMKSFAMRFSSKLAPTVSTKPVASPPTADSKPSSTKTVTSSPSSKLTSPVMSPRQAAVTNPRQSSSGHLSPPPSAFSKMRGPSSKLLAASGSSKHTSHLESGSSKLSSLLPGSGAASSKKIAADSDRQLRGPSSSSSKLKSPGGHQLTAESNTPAKPVSAAANGVAKPLFTRQLKLPNSSKGLPTHKY